MASETGVGQTAGRNTYGVMERRKEAKASRTGWKTGQDRVKVSYAKRKRPVFIQSICGHEESAEKSGGPSSKPKYSSVTDSEAVL